MNAVTQAVQGKFNVLGPLLDERTRRLWAAAEARAIGRGGITRVAEATGLSRGTVRAGVRELDSATPPAARAGGARIRTPGGGRKAVTERDPGLVKELEHLRVAPFTRGDPAIRSELDEADYPTGRAVTDEQMEGCPSNATR